MSVLPTFLWFTGMSGLGKRNWCGWTWTAVGKRTWTKITNVSCCVLFVYIFNNGCNRNISCNICKSASFKYFWKEERCCVLLLPAAHQLDLIPRTHLYFDFLSFWLAFLHQIQYSFRDQEKRSTIKKKRFMLVDICSRKIWVFPDFDQRKQILLI